MQFEPSDLLDNLDNSDKLLEALVDGKTIFGDEQVQKEFTNRALARIARNR